MKDEADDPFDLDKMRLAPELVERLVQVTPRKILKRREHFIQVPFGWLERLEGATGKTYALALHLLYRSWRNGGRPFTLANGMLKIDGISRASKWRALPELERRGLILVERRPRRSPIITVHDVSHP